MDNKLTEDRVVHDKNYRQDGTEVVLLRSPLTLDEWNRILQNQRLLELVEKYYKHSDLSISSLCKQLLKECKEYYEICPLCGEEIDGTKNHGSWCK